MKEKTTRLNASATSVNHVKKNIALPTNLKETLKKTDHDSQDFVYSRSQLSRFLDACCDCV